MKIEIKELSIQFDEKIVFDCMTGSIPMGEITGIVGKNGAGKTTFFNALSGLTQVGKDTFVFPENKSKHDIGFLQTENYHFQKMNGNEYVKLCSFASGNDSPDLNSLNKIFKLPLFESIDSYSSGMKKKLFLFGLLLQKKNILILDEPFNGLDLEASILLKKLILSLNKLGKTIIISSHILDSLTNICSSILLLERGEFKLFGKENYTDLEESLEDSISSADLDSVLKTF